MRGRIIITSIWSCFNTDDQTLSNNSNIGHHFTPDVLQLLSVLKSTRKYFTLKFQHLNFCYNIILDF